MSNLLILPIESSDVALLSSIQRRAFAPTHVQQQLFPSGAVTDEAIDAFIGKDVGGHIGMEGKGKYGMKAVRKGDGRVMGMGLWVEKGGEKDKEKEKGRKEIEWPVGTDVPWAEGFMKGLDLGVQERNLREFRKTVAKRRLVNSESSSWPDRDWLNTP